MPPRNLKSSRAVRNGARTKCGFQGLIPPLKLMIKLTTANLWLWVVKRVDGCGDLADLAEAKVAAVSLEGCAPAPEEREGGRTRGWGGSGCKGQHQHRSPSHVQNRTTPASFQPSHVQNPNPIYPSVGQLELDYHLTSWGIKIKEAHLHQTEKICVLLQSKAEMGKVKIPSLGILFPKCMTFKPPYFHDHIECLVKGMPVYGYDLEKR